MLTDYIKVSQQMANTLFVSPKQTATLDSMQLGTLASLIDTFLETGFVFDMTPYDSLSPEQYKQAVSIIAAARAVV